MDNQDPLKQDALERFNKGMNSVQPSLLDPVQAAGWKAANPQKQESSNGPAGPGTVELLLSYSKDKPWTKWTALFFGACALIYCWVNSFSLLSSIAIIAGASFFGYAIIGFAVLSFQLVFYLGFASLIFLLLYLIF